MGYVLGFFGILLALGAALPALLLALALLFPATVDRAAQALEGRPRRCLLRGTLQALPALLLALALTSMPSGLLKLLGWALLCLLLTLACLGAAGLARLLGLRLGWTEGSGAGGILRGALVLELALVVPLVGWFVLAPLALLATLGAALLALWPGRAARTLGAEAGHASQPA